MALRKSVETSLLEEDMQVMKLELPSSEGMCKNLNLHFHGIEIWDYFLTLKFGSASITMGLQWLPYDTYGLEGYKPWLFRSEIKQPQYKVILHSDLELRVALEVVLQHRPKLNSSTGGLD
uniref:Uncharacterized protein n=1 Tax=Cannabis sativa TaxID=3483 RepID=A0A803Q2D6_CANSA